MKQNTREYFTVEYPNRNGRLSFQYETEAEAREAKQESNDYQLANGYNVVDYIIVKHTIQTLYDGDKFATSFHAEVNIT